MNAGRWAVEADRALTHAPIARGRALVVSTQPLAPHGARTIIGAVLFHGTADRDTAAAQLDGQIKALARAVVAAAGGDPALITTTFEETTAELESTPHWKMAVTESRDAINKSPYRALWDDYVSPLFDEWVSFYKDKRHWYDAMTEVFTSWEDYTAWFDRVEALRKRVQAAGIGASVPALHPLPRSAQDIAQDAASDLWGILKIALYVALGLGGLFAIVMIAKTWKGRGA